MLKMTETPLSEKNINLPSQNKTFFSEISPRYPKLTEDGKIDAYQFIEASRSYIQIYDLLGTAFYVVKKDMLGNVEKLTKVYNKAPEKYKYLNDMIYLEKDDPKVVAVDALLWLKRALEFTSCFMRNMIFEWRSGSTNESVTHLVRAAYDKVLKKYHNWFVQNVFKMVVKAFPYRKDIIRMYYLGNDGDERELLIAAEKYMDELDANLLVLKNMYDKWGIESCIVSEKV